MEKKTIYKKIGKNIQKARKEQGLTQESFAEKMNVTWSYVAKLESGAQNISIGKLIDIAEYLNADLKILLEI